MGLLNINVKERFRYPEVSSHEFFKTINFKKLLEKSPDIETPWKPT